MKRLLVLAALLAPAPARAAMMQHYDLAGLVVKSDAIVVADRTAGKLAKYHVVRSIRGTIKAGTDLDFDDSLYNLDAAGIDARVYVFLSSYDGKPYIVSLRVVKAKQVMRFEQWNNPGGWQIVPQGRDPIDNWQSGVASINPSELETELGDAIRRVDALAAAAKLGDLAKRRAAILALLPATGAQKARGFYRDAFTEAASEVLVAAGDLEGALLARLHDHSGLGFPNGFGTPADLLAIANDAKKPLDVRVSAIDDVALTHGFFADQTVVRGLAALFGDPAPRVRIAAIVAASQSFDWDSSDKQEQQRVRTIRTEVRAALTKQFATETDSSALHALAEAFARGKLSVPARKQGPAVATRVAMSRGMLDIDVTCLRSVKLAKAALVITQGGKPAAVPAANVWMRCGKDESGTSGGKDVALAAGTYDLAVSVEIDRKAVTLPLGTLVIGRDGEATL